MDAIIPIGLAIIPCQDILRDSPRLRFIVAYVLYLETGLFFDLSLYGLFKSFTKFCKPGYQSIVGKTALVFGQKQFIAFFTPMMTAGLMRG